MPKKFIEPFGNVGPKRLPTESERQNGFPCGPADQGLFNRLFFELQSELGHLIAYAGLTDSSDDLQQVRKAVEALIAAALGSIGEEEGPDLTGFLLLNQARQRLPIFPEIQTADNRINVSSPGSGSVLVPPTIGVLHRGIYPLNTSDFTELERTFATVANKTYHLRLAMNPGAEALSLKDLANGTYNPTAAAETSSIFDTTYDDMLMAKVVTNGSNVATITNLRNAVRLTDVLSSTGSYTLPNQNGSNRDATLTYGWGRTPHTIAVLEDFGGASEWQVNDHDWNVDVVLTRYSVLVHSLHDGATSGTARVRVGAF